MVETVNWIMVSVLVDDYRLAAIAAGRVVVSGGKIIKGFRGEF
jgi:hypothetical protein